MSESVQHFPCDSLMYNDEKSSHHEPIQPDNRYIDCKLYYGKVYPPSEDIEVSLATRRAQKRAETAARKDAERKAQAAAAAAPAEDAGGDDVGGGDLFAMAVYEN